MAQISFFQPNLVIDPRQGKLWDIELRLGTVSMIKIHFYRRFTGSTTNKCILYAAYTPGIQIKQFLVIVIAIAYCKFLK